MNPPIANPTTTRAITVRRTTVFALPRVLTTVCTSESSRSAILFPSHKFLQIRFRPADGARQRNFGQVMHVDARNQTLIRVGHRFLRLHHFDVVGYARREAVASLLERLVRRDSHCPRPPPPDPPRSSDRAMPRGPDNRSALANRPIRFYAAGSPHPPDRRPLESAPESKMLKRSDPVTANTPWELAKVVPMSP